MKKIFSLGLLNYSFDQNAFIKSYDEYLDVHHINKNTLNEYLSKEGLCSIETVRKHVSGRNYPSCIEQVFAYGKVIKNDRYAFLTLCDSSDEFSKKVEEILKYNEFAEACAQAVKSKLVRVLSEYAASGCFNKKEIRGNDILTYYRRKIDEVELLIQQIYKHHTLVCVLMDLAEQIKRFICLYTIPGVPEEWYIYNPNLRYYSVAFDLFDKEPELFNAIKCGEYKGISLEYYLSEEELARSKEYFKKLEEENMKYNYHYNIEDYYQQELIKTLNKIFENKIEKLIDKE